MADNPEFRRRAIALHAAITVYGSSIFFPSGGVFLAVTFERMQRIRSGERTDPHTRAVATDDLWSVYSEWHETVHMAQLVTCPYVRLVGYRLATVAIRASARDADQDLAELLDDYRAAQAMLEDRWGDGFTAWEIIETQAVVQGLKWLTGSEPVPLRALAERLYTEVRPWPEYVRLIDALGDRIGDGAAIALLPRLCFLALQTWGPSQSLTSLCAAIERSGVATRLAAASPREFCEWAGQDPARISRSLRERDPEIEALPWMSLFGDYFELFEGVADVDERLELLLGPRGEPARRMFAPRFTVFTDGHVQLARGPGPDATDEDWIGLWIGLTSNVIDGLDRLAKADERGDPAPMVQ